MQHNTLCSNTRNMQSSRTRLSLYSTRLETSSRSLEPLVQMPSVLARGPYMLPWQSDDKIDPSLQEISNKTESATEVINQDKPLKTPGVSFYNLENLSSSEVCILTIYQHNVFICSHKTMIWTSQGHPQRKGSMPRVKNSQMNPPRCTMSQLAKRMNAMAKSIAVANAIKSPLPPPPEIVIPSNNLVWCTDVFSNSFWACLSRDDGSWLDPTRVCCSWRRALYRSRISARPCRASLRCSCILVQTTARWVSLSQDGDRYSG